MSDSHDCVECFDERLDKARCCALDLADGYVKLASKGRETEQTFNNLMMLGAYMSSLERYACERKNKLSSPCLSCDQVEKIFDQISILCGGCSCNCN